MRDIIQYINNHNLENKMFDEQTYNDLLNLCKVKWGPVNSNYFNNYLTDDLIKQERYYHTTLLEIAIQRQLKVINKYAVRINNIYRNLDRYKYKLTKKDIEFITEYYNFHEFLINEYLKNNEGKPNIINSKEKTKWCYLTIHHDKENVVTALSDWYQNNKEHWDLGYQNKENLTKLDWVIHSVIHHVINEVWNKNAWFINHLKWYLWDYFNMNDKKVTKTKNWDQFVLTRNQIEYMHNVYTDDDLKIIINFLDRKKEH